MALNNFFYIKEFLVDLQSEMQPGLSIEKQSEIIKSHVGKFFFKVDESKKRKIEKLSLDFINIDQNNGKMDNQDFLIEFDKILSLEEKDDNT